MAKTTRPIIIFECANTHGGVYNLLERIVKEHSEVKYAQKHIKFQPLHPDKIATPNYEWYEVYKELHFSKEQWLEIINLADSLFDAVWLDLFDVYGVEILKESLNSINGIKLQASVLFAF